MSAYPTIEWRAGTVRMLDQRQLPHAIVFADYDRVDQVASAIQDMVIRGAPAIGVAAAYGLALAALNSQAGDVGQMVHDLEAAGSVLLAARPTAVNLSWAVDRVLQKVRSSPAAAPEEIRRLVLAEANAMAEEDVRTNQQMGLNALPLIPPKATFIHHCNTGALATVGYGTALGVIRAAHEHGRDVFVYVDETRPLLQGAKLTSWELRQLDIPHAVIVDGASGYVMKNKHVDLVTVGCDRVAANGDTANKIGTYNLAVVARAHNVPFYVVGPTTTIDLSIPDGDHIKIEERSAIEVARIGSQQIMPEGAQAVNPAFDVTPAELITAIITQEGIAYPPYTESLPPLVAKAAVRRTH